MLKARMNKMGVYAKDLLLPLSPGMWYNAEIDENNPFHEIRIVFYATKYSFPHGFFELKLEE